jgi:superfamily II DNA helicase RecQ
MRVLAPTGYKNLNDDEARKVAARQVEALGVMKEAALRRAINLAPAEHNTKLRAMAAVIKHDLGQKWTDRKGAERKGKAAVVFTDRAQEAKLIHDHLRGQGVRVALYHGGLSPQEKEAIRTGFQPEGGAAPAYDVVVGTASMEAGVNMQRASVIHHYDVPQTEKSHAQRTGRAYRQGQLGDVDVHNWYTDHDFEDRARRRLHRKEDLAAVFQTPLGSLDEAGIGSHYNSIIARKHQAALPQVA